MIFFTKINPGKWIFIQASGFWSYLPGLASGTYILVNTLAGIIGLNLHAVRHYICICQWLKISQLNSDIFLVYLPTGNAKTVDRVNVKATLNTLRLIYPILFSCMSLCPRLGQSAHITAVETCSAWLTWKNMAGNFYVIISTVQSPGIP